MNIYDRLRLDHEKQRDLARRIMETSGDSEARRGLWREFEAEATSHAAAEEEVFYSALIAIPEGQEQARHSVAEHAEAAALIEAIHDTEMSSGAWIQKFAKLKDELEHHIEEEEKGVFSLARRLFSDGTARKMTSAFEARKRAERDAA